MKTSRDSVRWSRGPSNGALAEALFELSEREPPGERRIALLKAGYAVLDSPGRGRRAVLDGSPPWLRPLLHQLVSCPGPGALEAAVMGLGGGRTPRRRGARERFLSRVEVDEILAAGPEDLLPSRLRGAFHWHTRASDGSASLEVMARACLRRGASWAVVADHSRGLEVASGLDREGVALQRQLVAHWNRVHGSELRLFQGLEVEVLEDGTLDVPHPERLEVDCVVAAVHRQFDPDRDQTERLLRAVATPGVRVLAHPRGRLFHHRPGLRARWERVFAACAESGVAVEVNGFPRRQDLDWDLARLAADSGCVFLLASDAHAPRHLDFDAFACAIGVRAALPPSQVLNLRQAEDFAAWLAEASG